MLSLRLSLLNNIFNQHLLDEILYLSLSSTEPTETGRREDRMVFQSLLRETSAPLGHAAVTKRTSSASQFIHALTRRRRPPVRVLLSICVSMARARARMRAFSLLVGFCRAKKLPDHRGRSRRRARKVEWKSREINRSSAVIAIVILDSCDYLVCILLSN